jgi:hypothetical protein
MVKKSPNWSKSRPIGQKVAQLVKKWPNRWSNPPNLPEHDDESVEDVESVADVTEESVGGKFQDHFDGKDDTEHLGPTL